MGLLILLTLVGGSIYLLGENGEPVTAVTVAKGEDGGKAEGFEMVDSSQGDSPVQAVEGDSELNAKETKKNLEIKQNKELSQEQLFQKAFDYGKTEGVDPNENLQVSSVYEALRTDQNPERLSPLFSPKAFDLISYQEDPSSYINTIEPGRVFQSLQPGDDVPQLKRVSPKRVELVQGEKTELAVKTLPGMPCSFTSFDLGAFENQLTAITVKADDDGVARTTFIASSGTIEGVNILSSSPVTSGQVRFIINIGYSEEARQRQLSLESQLTR